uniref:IQ motif containing K n=1 Tax=Nannospalax galili TaxID=1026970 RepID=A0A8C6RTX6_NANGA
MAALGQASSRSMPPEGAGGSVDLSVTTRSPVPAVSPERPVSPGQVAEPPGKNLWEQICEGRRPPVADPGATRAGPAGPAKRVTRAGPPAAP